MGDSFPAGMLSDTGIRKYFNNGIKICTDGKDGKQFNLDEQLHTGSVDLRFRHLYYRFTLEKGQLLSYELLKSHQYTTPEELSSNQKLRINPGEIILTTTLETVHLSEEFAGLISGRSSIARLGIMVHCCQEFIHPGHGQAIPLQIVNLGPNPVELDLDVPICQIIFFKLSSPASEKYTDRKDAKYSKEENPVPSKIYQELGSGATSVIVNVGEGKSNEIPRKTVEKEGFKKRNFWRIINKYVAPFIPGIIMLLVISPFLNNYVVNKNVEDIHFSIATILSVLMSIPLPYVFSLILLVFFVFAKKKGE